MLKIIYKSIQKELFVAFLLTLAFLNSILMMEKMLRLSRLLSGVGASIFDMMKIIFLLQPQLLILTIPMSLLLSVLLVYGRMNSDSEITVLRASGMDFTRISSPVMLLGLFSFFIGIMVSFYVGPWSSIRLRNEITRIISVRSTFAIEEGTFNTSFKDVVILVKGKKSSDTLEDIFIYDERNRSEPRIMMAREGRIFMQDASIMGILLTDGYILLARAENTTELFFDKYRMTLTLGIDSQAPKKAELMPFELIRKASGSSIIKEKIPLLLEFHRRLSLPAVCLLLVFLGPPLSLMSGKSGRLGGLAIGLLVFTLYYVILIYGENLALAAKIPHYIGAWSATVILGVFALFMFFREDAR